MLSPKEESEAELRNGEALSKLGRYDEAESSLQHASELDPTSSGPLRALGRVYAAQGETQQQMDVLYRELSRSEGERKVEILLEMGDVAAGKLGDSEYAAKSYLLALSERPSDRAILTKLMQLYGAEKDWPQLIQVITRLAEVVEEPKHKAKYLHTASMIASRELSDLKLASNLLDKALEHDPDRVPAIDEALSMHQRLKNYDGMKRMLKLRIASAQRVGDKERLLGSLDRAGRCLRTLPRSTRSSSGRVRIGIAGRPGQHAFPRKTRSAVRGRSGFVLRKGRRNPGQLDRERSVPACAVQAACARCTPRRVTPTPPGAHARLCTCSDRPSRTKSASSSACAARNRQ